MGYTADLDLYAYVGNDPLNQTDPNGDCPMCIGAIIGAVAGAAIETGVELYNNGGDIRSLNGGRIGSAALVGAVTGATGGLAGEGAAAVLTATRGAQFAGSLGGRVIVGAVTGSTGGAAGEATRQAVNGERPDAGRIARAGAIGAVAGGVGGAAANRVEGAMQSAGFRRATTADVTAPNRPGVYTTAGNSSPRVAVTTANVAQATVTAAARSVGNQVANPRCPQGSQCQ